MGFDMGFFNPVGAIGQEMGADDTFNWLNDPMDLMGYQAEGVRDDVSNIQMKSAQDAIAAQEVMLAQTNALYDPYRESAMGGWGDYTSMTTGGEYSGPMSPQYGFEMDRNAQAVNRGLAAKGLFNSSARGAALGDVALQAGQSEAARQYGKQLDMQRLGTGAIQGLGQAGQTAGSNVSATYGNLGSNLNSMYQNYGAQRQDSLSQGANALYGAQSYVG